MGDKTIFVGREELLEWLANWGEIGEGDEIITVRIGYGQSIEFVISNLNEDE